MSGTPRSQLADQPSVSANAAPSPDSSLVTATPVGLSGPQTRAPTIARQKPL